MRILRILGILTLRYPTWASWSVLSWSTHRGLFVAVMTNAVGEFWWDVTLMGIAKAVYILLIVDFLKGGKRI